VGPNLLPAHGTAHRFPELHDGFVTAPKFAGIFEMPDLGVVHRDGLEVRHSFYRKLNIIDILVEGRPMLMVATCCLLAECSG
jgi:hypothetical protein